MAAGDYERFMGHRQQAVEDLQRIFRRANGLAPVNTPDDLGTLKNIVRPALPMAKFGAAGTAYFEASPLVSLELLKLAAWYNDLWEGTKSLGTGLGRIVATPVLGGIGAVRGAVSGWNRGSGIWAPINALGDAYSGLVSPIRTGVGEIYSGTKGVLGGGLSAIPGAAGLGRDIMGSGAGRYIRGADQALGAVLPYGPELALLFATGGISGAGTAAGAGAGAAAGTAGRAAGLAGRLAGGAKTVSQAAGRLAGPAKTVSMVGGGAEMAEPTAEMLKDFMSGRQVGTSEGTPVPGLQAQIPNMRPTMDMLTSQLQQGGLRNWDGSIATHGISSPGWAR